MIMMAGLSGDFGRDSEKRDGCMVDDGVFYAETCHGDLVASPHLPLHISLLSNTLMIDSGRHGR
jgi:hypothetical protein